MEYMLSCTTKKCQNWHFLVVMAWRHELNLLPLHYQKVPILAKIRNDMEEIKRDTMVYPILLVEYRSIQSISFAYTFAFTFMVF